MGGLKYRASEQKTTIKSILFFAEYSSYRTTEFKVQALSGFVPEEGERKIKRVFHLMGLRPDSQLWV